jgi:hypothetical protein
MNENWSALTSEEKRKDRYEKPGKNLLREKKGLMTLFT